MRRGDLNEVENIQDYYFCPVCLNEGTDDSMCCQECGWTELERKHFFDDVRCSNCNDHVENHSQTAYKVIGTKNDYWCKQCYEEEVEEEK